ncbi:MAG TPA: SURF1 family protein [Gemmatimonadaceae bacterium]|nr:SURF1 family protein [Gemmatimonadaceae bacterium]
MRASVAIGSRMKPSTIAFLAFATVAAIICVRLGLWQLDRRELRRASNATISARGGLPTLPVTELSGDTSQTRFRRVVVAGVPDFEHEILLTHRGNDGAPGLDIITPIRIPGQDSAVLVNRGWVYSPDGMTTDLARWREPAATFTGYVDSFERSTATDSVRGRAIRWMDYRAIARTFPYPIRDYYVVALADSAPVTEQASTTPRIVRLQPPKLGEGPHLSYALQWFAFATIALVGASIVAARSMRSGSP